MEQKEKFVVWAAYKRKYKRSSRRAVQDVIDGIVGVRMPKDDPDEYDLVKRRKTEVALHRQMGFAEAGNEMACAALSSNFAQQVQSHGQSGVLEGAGLRAGGIG